MNSPLRIEASGLSCSRGGRRLFERLAFQLSGGQALVVTGPNGIGKTTLLRALAGFMRPDEGTLAVEGAGEEATLAQISHFIGHRDGLKAALTVRENLSLAPALLGGSGVAVMEAAARLDLVRLLDLPTGVLSAGQRRRTALARLLVAHRPVWLLDEPTSALDAQSQASAASLMAAHVAAGGIVMAATHLPLGLSGAREMAFDATGRATIWDAA